jgi:hypothetical protein
MIGRVISLRRPNANLVLGTVLDLHNWKLPERFEFTGISDFGWGTRVGFDVAVSPKGVKYAVNLRIPTEEDLALLP